MKSNRKFAKNDAAFTGLEAAIVLIAFVVVAAVFSYVMLGAGFFTSQKSKEVVHTGVDQATSSLQLAGDVMGVGNPAGATLNQIYVTLALTAGNNPVDLTKLTVSYKDSTHYNPVIWSDPTGVVGPGNGQILWVATNAPQDTLLDKNEKVRLTIDASVVATPVNTQFTLEVKPSTGAVLPITVTTPPVIGAAVAGNNAIMKLV
jgi:archaeal flagellin FlaB